MRTVADRALDRPRLANEYRESLTILQREVIRLSALTETLLVLARADEGQLALQKEPIDVADFLGDVAARWQATVEARGLVLELDLPDEGVVSADQMLLARLLDNLVDNACRYTPSGGAISLAARSDTRRVAPERLQSRPGNPPRPARPYLRAIQTRRPLSGTRDGRRRARTGDVPDHCGVAWGEGAPRRAGGRGDPLHGRPSLTRSFVTAVQGGVQVRGRSCLPVAPCGDIVDLRQAVSGWSTARRTAGESLRRWGKARSNTWKAAGASVGAWHPRLHFSPERVAVRHPLPPLQPGSTDE